MDFKMIRGFFLTMLLTGFSAKAQNQFLDEKIGMITVNAGLQQLGNQSLNNWLANNGVVCSDSYGTNIGLRLLTPSTWSTNKKSFLIGFDLSYTFANHPSVYDMDGELLFGKSYKLTGKDILICPLLGIGGYLLKTQASDPVPTTLTKYGVMNGAIYRNYLLLSPRILIIKGLLLTLEIVLTNFQLVLKLVVEFF